MTSKSASLHVNPIEFSNRLVRNHGVLDYSFREPLDPARTKVDLTKHVPSNLDAINEALARSRDDLPDIAAWRDYCNSAWAVSHTGQEDEVAPLITSFFGRALAKGAGRIFEKALMVNVGHLLPPGHPTIRPDRVAGMWPDMLETQQWLHQPLSQFIQGGAMICVNEIHEFKSSAGKLIKAVSFALICPRGLLNFKFRKTVQLV